MQEEEKKNPEHPAPEKEPETEPTKEPETEPAKEPEEPPAGEPTVETEGEGEQPQADPEKEKLMRELTIARAQLAAIQANIDPRMAPDAVILAVYSLEQEGKTADEKSIASALEKVRERHPEWKAGKTPAAPDKGGADEPGKDSGDKKTPPPGKVIF